LALVPGSAVLVAPSSAASSLSLWLCSLFPQPPDDALDHLQVDTSCDVGPVASLRAFFATAASTMCIAARISATRRAAAAAGLESSTTRAQDRRAVYVADVRVVAAPLAVRVAASVVLSVENRSGA